MRNDSPKSKSNRHAVDEHSLLGAVSKRYLAFGAFIPPAWLRVGRIGYHSSAANSDVLQIFNILAKPRPRETGNVYSIILFSVIDCEHGPEKLEYLNLWAKTMFLGLDINGPSLVSLAFHHDIT